MARKTVRTAVKDYLTTNCSSFSGGFFQPYITDKTTTKPFGVVKVAGDDGAYQGAVKTLQVMCHAARDDFDTLDSLVLSVIKALDRVRISCGTTGAKTFYITPVYVGTTGDWADDDRETIVRTAEFEVVIAR
jgi:hypothetical protein